MDYKSEICPVCNSKEEFRWGEFLTGNYGDHDQVTPDYCLNCMYVQFNPYQQTETTITLEFYQQCWELQINPHKEGFYKSFFESTINFRDINFGYD